MKKILICLFLAFGITSLSQNNEFNYAGELAKNVKIPTSPEAAAFANYGDYSANLNLGKPEISIPLYTYKGSEMDLPISISYDIDARKVEDIPTGIGMGWNLNLGGAITRITQGLPDECVSPPQGGSAHGGTYQSFIYPFGTASAFRTKYNNYKDKQQGASYGVFLNATEAQDYLTFINLVQSGSYDTQPDHFSVNAPGLSDRLMYIFDDTTSTIKPIWENNPRTDIKIAYDNWWLVADDGTQYWFEAPELTYSFNGLDINDLSGAIPGPKFMYYHSTWHLTKIVSPNGKDVYEFEYVDFDLWSQQITSWTTKKITTRPIWPITQWVATEVDVANTYKIAQKALSKVKHNGQEIIAIDLQSRPDYDNNNRIASITVKSPLDGTTTNFFKFDNNHYFGSGSNKIDKRLKLNKIEIAGAGYSGSGHVFEREYSFEYEGDASTLPPRNSKAQDEYGFFNGQGNNQVLYPSIQLSDHTLPGANRKFSWEYAKIGILTRINFPTGGFTEFEYGPHIDDPNESPNGIRIEAIVSNTDENTPVIRKEFDYQEQYINPYGKPIMYYVTNEILESGGNLIEKHHQLAKAVKGDAPYISYRKVVEKRVNAVTQAGNYGETEYLFYDNDGGTTINQPSKPLNAPWYIANITKGILEKNTVKNSSGSILTVSDNDYLPFSNTGFYESFAIEDNGNNAYLSVEFVPVTGGVQPQLVYNPPNTSCNCWEPKYARLVPIRPKTIPQYLSASTQTSTQTLDGNDITTISTSTFEEGNLNYLLRESNSSTSENNTTITTRYTYPADLYNQGNTVINDLVEANRLSTPIEVKVYEDVDGTEELLSTQVTDYATFGSDPTYILPLSIKTKRRGDTNFDSRLTLEAYDSNGNLVQARKPSGSPTSYIWGYNGLLPVAKVENMLYSDIEDLPYFGSGFTLNGNLSVQQENHLRAVADVMVTTYTYTSFMEVSTIKDPRGKKSTFVYDDENRLKYVLDQDNNVLGKNEYNYRIND